MAEQVHAQGHLEIRDAQGGIVRAPLIGDRLIIGRAADAAIKLESSTVSRHHAEVFRDPFGRWWVRDLKSRNGTIVNGKIVAEEMLRSGDTLQIEDFLIILRLPMPTSERPRAKTEAGITLMDAAGAPVQRLRDVEAPKIASTHLSKLNEFRAAILNTADENERLLSLCQLMVGAEFHGTTAVALRLYRDQPDGEKPEVLCEPQSSKNWRKGELPYVSKTMLREVRKSQAPVIASNVGSTGIVELSLAGNVMAMSAVACPIRNEGDYLDILYVAFPAEFGTTEWLALASLAAEHFMQAESTLLNQKQSEAQALVNDELAKARNIQMRLVPRNLEAVPVQVAIGFEPCKWVGGDYVDVLQCGDGKVLLIVADVCGKGLQASLITASLHATVRTNALGSVGLTDLITRLNEYLCETLPEESFVTAMGIMLDPKTGEMECVNAGHPPAFVTDADGNIRQLQAGANLPLGYMPVPFEASKDTLPAGHLLAVYTDGCNEMTNEANEMLGIDALSDMVKTLYKGQAATPAPALGDNFKKLLDTFQGNAMAADDRTFLLVRRT